MSNYAFRKAARQIAPKNKKRFISDIMRILGVKTEQSYYLYERGGREPKASQAEKIKILCVEKYNIPDDQVWGKR
jgi:hypothetical protein